MTVFIPVATPVCADGTAAITSAGRAEYARPMPKPFTAEAISSSQGSPRFKVSSR